MKPVADESLNYNGQLSNLIPMDSPETVLEEVKHILLRMDPEFDTAPISNAFHLIIDLFHGDYPGYQACNTEFHDLHHTCHVFLAMARLIHGTVVQGEQFTQRQICHGMMAAMFHDSGYIQEIDDTTGTGAKYTRTHVERSMALFVRVAEKLGVSPRDIPAVQSIILCTNLSVDIETIQFPDDPTRMLGKIMGAADVLAQMADRVYIEKLLFLYNEFRESGIGGYESAVDLLRKTIGFYDFVTQRLASNLDGVDRFMKSHFVSRWHIDEDLYRTAIGNQKQYLKEILESPDSKLLKHLKRGGILDSYHRDFGKET